MKPLCIELFCGTFGWSAGWLERGGRAVGFDIEHQAYHGPVPTGADLVLQDVCTLHGRQFRDASLILASPPCQGYSYRAMPWKRAKALPPPDNELFDACFRLQREACEAAGQYIPMVVENVSGAQKWVGRAKWHYGSYYLWGDVPALMPITLREVMKRGVAHRSNGETNFHSSAERALKVPGMNFHDYAKTGKLGRSFQAAAVESLKGIPHKPTGHWTNPAENGSIKCGGDWFNASQPSISRLYGSKSPARKAASAAIARIPLELSRYIAQVYWPSQVISGDFPIVPNAQKAEY